MCTLILLLISYSIMLFLPMHETSNVRRTLKNGLSEEEKKHIAAYIKGY